VDSSCTPRCSCAVSKIASMHTRGGTDAHPVRIVEIGLHGRFYSPDPFVTSMDAPAAFIGYFNRHHGLGRQPIGIRWAFVNGCRNYDRLRKPAIYCRFLGSVVRCRHQANLQRYFKRPFKRCHWQKLIARMEVVGAGKEVWRGYASC
jgi:hypothetical protein